MKSKILYIHHGVGIGGAPISLKNLVSSMVELDKYDVTVLFMFDSEATTLFDEINCKKIVLNKPYFYFNHSSRWKPIWQIHWIILMVLSWFYTAFIRAPKILRELNPDLIHLNSSVLTDWSYAARKLGIPNIMHIREAISKGHFGLRFRLSRYLILKYPDVRLFISKENIDRLSIPENKSSVIVYNDIGQNFRSLESSKDDTLDLDNSKVHFLYLGGLSEIKGLSVIESALEYLEDNVVVYIAGHFAISKALSKFPKLDHPKVKIIGLIRDVPNYLSRMDVLLCPIRSTHFCRPALEASSMGVPVIISDVEGAQEMVLNGETGFHFENGNSKDLAEKMNILALNKDLRVGYSKEAKNFYRMYFSPEVSKHKIIRIYNQILS